MPLEKCGKIQSVLIAVRVHLFPFRTQKLSSLALKILGGQLPGKISRCRHKQPDVFCIRLFFTLFYCVKGFKNFNRSIICFTNTHVIYIMYIKIMAQNLNGLYGRSEFQTKGGQVKSNVIQSKSCGVRQCVCRSC